MDGDYGSTLPIVGNKERVTVGKLGDTSNNWIHNHNPTYKLPQDITDEHCYEFDRDHPDETTGWLYLKVEGDVMDAVYSRQGKCPDSFPDGGKRYMR